MSDSMALCPVRTDNFIETEVDGERVLMQVENGCFFTMNETSELIWNSIDGQHSLRDIQTIVSEFFKISLETCADDVDNFVRELEKNKLISFA